MLAKRYNVVQMRQFFSSKSCVRLLSLPMRGEWIEMKISYIWLKGVGSLSPCGESGLKFGFRCVDGRFRRLSPCGESGLKLPRVRSIHAQKVSPHAGRVD